MEIGKQLLMLWISFILLSSYRCFSDGLSQLDIYSFKVKNIKGDLVDLSTYRGKVMLIVNVASECGYTDNHYRELNELQNIFTDGSFIILAFPCNQFGSQEPKRNSAIERFVKHNYGADFQLFSKIQVIGENAHPLYKWLKTAHGEEPHWNFCKYLIDKQGNVAKFESPTVSPLLMMEDIEKLLIHGTLNEETPASRDSNREEL